MSRPLGSSRPAGVRIAVAADHSLVAESVRAALHNRGYDAVVVRWPIAVPDPDVAVLAARGSGAHPARAQPTTRARATGGETKASHERTTAWRARRSAGSPPAAAVMISDLASADQVEGARHLVSRLRVPWLVLAGASQGPAWGAVYDAGARIVVPTSAGLDETSELIDELAAGTTTPTVSRRQRRELVHAWRELARERTALAARIESLTVREEEILQHLHAGLAVRLIAEEGEVAEATVRSQVKAILRKLDVNSQIAAVAAYEELRNDPATATEREVEPLAPREPTRS